MSTKLIKILALTFTIFIFQSCEKEEERFPYVSFDVTFNISTQLNNVAVGEYVFKNKYAYGGLIIYHKTSSEYLAFDRACPHKPRDRCILEPDENFETVLTCPCCGSKFLITDDGSVFEGPATRPLYQYETYYIPPNQLRVRN